MTRRKKQIGKALEHLGSARFLAFIRAVEPDGGCLAVKLMSKELKAGRRPEDLLLEGDEYGYILDVEPIGMQRYRIAFGCHPGPEVGDGGEWEVRFEGDVVAGITEGISWVS